MKKLTAAVLCGLILFLLPSSAYSAERRQTIGVIPFYAPEKIWALYSPFVDYLNKTTGSTWELKLYHNHETIINDICSGTLAVAMFGPVPFGRAYEQCGVIPIALALGPDGKPYYRSIIVTSDFSLTSLKQLKGRKFGIFEGSTAAHILPLKMLEDEGVTIDALSPVFINGQDKIINALLTHEIAAAGIKESLFRRFSSLPLKAMKISEPVPNFTFCSTPGLDRGILKTFSEALLKLNPLSNTKDQAMVRDWDDELKFGFTRPPADFILDARKLNGLFKRYHR